MNFENKNPLTPTRSVAERASGSIDFHQTKPQREIDTPLGKLILLLRYFINFNSICSIFNYCFDCRGRVSAQSRGGSVDWISKNDYPCCIFHVGKTHWMFNLLTFRGKQYQLFSLRDPPIIIIVITRKVYVRFGGIRVKKGEEERNSIARRRKMCSFICKNITSFFMFSQIFK